MKYYVVADIHGFYTEFKQTLEEKGLECGYNGSKWYSLHQIRKFAIEIEKKHLTNGK